MSRSSVRGSAAQQDTGLASMGHVFRRLLEMHGLDAFGIAKRAGLDLAAAPEPGERIDIDRLDAMLRVAIPLIDDPAFGLKAARCWHPGNLGVLGHAWLSSSTMRTGLARMARYFRLLGERSTLQAEEADHSIKVSFRTKREDPAVTAVFVDIAMSVLLDMCRMNAGAALRPLTASLRRTEPKQVEAYERFFGCLVHFGAADNAFVLSRKDADRLLPSSNKQLAAVFDQMLTAQLAQLDRGDVVSRCKVAVLERLPSGEVSAEHAAEQLHMSPRTLQRRLAKSKTTYLQLVDDTRKDLALRFIEDRRRSITDITFSLGFAQPSAFTRAFRRWTGVSPTEYRSRETGSSVGGSSR